LCANAAATSIPFGLCSPPLESETAITIAPSAARSFERWLPTLPKPWSATRVPAIDFSRLRSASRMQ
jgi:hypothetical protein